MDMKNWVSNIRRQLLSVVCFMGVAGQAMAGGGELIIFMGEASNPVERDFRDKYLPEIKKMATAQGLNVKEKNIAKGAPAVITSTPAIIFQNHLGRSRFIGRYHYLDKIKTFVRTVSRMPQADVPNEKHDVLVWQKERARIYSPIKLTPLDGVIPPGFDQAAFHKEALATLAKGASTATLQALFSAERTDRAMYLALYPYHGTDGKFFLSAEMYSQFNCIEPLFKRFDQPFEGTFKAWQKVVEAAGQALQDEVFKQLGSIAKGDGMVPVPSKTPAKTWEELGLDLPKAPEGGAGVTAATVPLGRRWEFAGPVEPTTPVLNFNFLAPLDYYAGEVKTVFGELEFSDGPLLDNTLGKFGIETNSLTMGDPSLDHHVQEMIAIAEYPQATFTFEQITSLEQPKLAFGALTQFAVRGTLSFLGIQAPIDVTAQMEPVLDEQGAARIQVYASFNLRLKERYNLDGPDGPAPSNDSMQFFMNFLLKPKA